ncbi:hypothetical protein GPL15_01710 [Clostridium sp. MCC353]|uniref:hypothetical protein n=1 Tax=Clostridium sp. MCC353 TaxID=2592646 RepID=UPI001C029646|nr:hypothetical protein [Clostridium sp. MCC353]MBT9775223.1 hypothetical protein [Clostridium sp. MCC353]
MTGLILFGIFLAAVIIMDLVMLISLIKQGDERRRMIVGKTSTYTLLGMVGYFVVCIVESFFRGYKGINPFIILASTAIIYCVLLFGFKKKYGD